MMMMMIGFANNNKVICVTQPRRVAAVAAASRVAKELGLTFGKEVSYSVRDDEDDDDDD